MADFTLRDLYTTELTDLYNAERQIIEALPTMMAAAASPDLREAFEKHLGRTRVHAERLDLLMKQLGATASGVADGSAIRGLIRAGDERIRQSGQPQVRDAALIAAAQQVEHYEIAAYGCARAHARQLGDDEAADLLQQTLDEEGAADHELTRIAEAGINQSANEGALKTPVDRDRGRLRYVDADDLGGDIDYGDLRVRNRADEKLGRVDGFVVDYVGRPYYLVVDSGGWFAGRRYVVPIGRADLRRADRTLVLDLDKDVLSRYPEFHRSAFLAMSDDEARRYEWRVLEAIDPAAARRMPATWRRDQLPYYTQPAWMRTSWADREAGIVRERRSVEPRRDATLSEREREAVIARDEERIGRPTDEDIR